MNSVLRIGSGIGIALLLLSAFSVNLAMASTNEQFTAGSKAGSTTITRPAWQLLASDTSPQSQGCFTMNYPNATWSRVTCSETSVPPELMGNTVDEVTTTSTAIGEVEGLISDISGFTSESDTQQGSDAYSLQINSGRYTTTTSYTSGDVTAWVQFVYQNNGPEGAGVITIEFVLIGYSPCPSSRPSGLSTWQALDGDCYAYVDETAATELPSNLANVMVEGLTAQSGNDVVKQCDFSDDVCTSLSFTDWMNLGSGTNWELSEFNVLGWGNSSVADFNHGTSMEIENHLWDQSDNPITPNGCITGGYAAETNNMSKISCSSGSGYLDFTEGT
jgi:hypothetical protein